MMRRLGLSVTAAALCLVADPAHADVAGRYESKDPSAFFDFEMTIETDDAGNVRVQMAGQSSYYLLSGGELFAVSRGLTGSTVVRVDDLLIVQAEAMARIGVMNELEVEPTDAPAMDFVELGTETVGAWNGKAYGLKSALSEAAPRPLIVLSADPRIAPLGRAMRAMQGDMIAGMSRFTGIFAQAGRDYDALLSNGTPVRMTQIELTDVSFDPIEPDRFKLPAEPMSLEELRTETAPLPPPPTLPPREKRPAQD